MAKILNATHRFKAIPIKSPMTFHKIRTNNPKICGTTKDTELTSTLRKKNKAGGIPWANSKQYYRAAAIKPCGTGTESRLQISGTEQSPAVNPGHTHSRAGHTTPTAGRAISDKGGKNRQSLPPVVLEKLDGHM